MPDFFARKLTEFGLFSPQWIQSWIPEGATTMSLPGLRGTEHIGFTVPDLDEAERFFVDILGCELVYSLGPFARDDDDWMLEHMGVHPRTVMRELRFFRCGTGPNFEVFQYEPADVAHAVRPFGAVRIDGARHPGQHGGSTRGRGER